MTTKEILEFFKKQYAVIRDKTVNGFTDYMVNHPNVGFAWLALLHIILVVKFVW